MTGMPVDGMAEDVRTCPDVSLVLNVRRLMRTLHAKSHSSVGVHDLSMLCVLMAAGRGDVAVPMAASAIANAAGVRRDEAASSMTRLTRSGCVRRAGRSKGCPTYVTTPAGTRACTLIGPVVACGPAGSMLGDAPAWLVARAFSCARASQPTNRELVLIGHLFGDDVADVTGLCDTTVASHDHALAEDGLLHACDGAMALTRHGVARAVSVASTVQGYVYATGLHDDIDRERVRRRRMMGGLTP